jgi:hypothetical protein
MMRKFLGYLKALNPRKIWGRIMAVAALLSTPTGAVILISTGYRPQRQEWLMLAVIELSVAVTLVLASGFVAFSAEQARADRAVAVVTARWRGLNHAARLTLIDALRGSPKIPEFTIFNSRDEDCQRLGADLYHSISEVWNISFPPMIHQVPLASGITIVARADEPRAELLKSALKKIGVHAEVEIGPDYTPFTIQIGPKVL